MTTNRQLVVRIQLDTFSIGRELRKAIRAAREMSWAIRFKAPTDEEQLAFRWAVAHVRAGRTDLAAEDLRWLGARS